MTDQIRIASCYRDIRDAGIDMQSVYEFVEISKRYGPEIIAAAAALSNQYACEEDGQ
jgi:hypothetical protein